MDALCRQQFLIIGQADLARIDAQPQRRLLVVVCGQGLDLLGPIVLQDLKQPARMGTGGNRIGQCQCLQGIAFAQKTPQNRIDQTHQMGLMQPACGLGRGGNGGVVGQLHGIELGQADQQQGMHRAGRLGQRPVQQLLQPEFVTRQPAQGFESHGLAQGTITAVVDSVQRFRQNRLERALLKAYGRDQTGRLGAHRRSRCCAHTRRSGRALR